jgi:hypothetical protein
MIDTFNYKHYHPVVIRENERTKKKWDLEESKGFINGISPYGSIYKIRNIHNNNNETLVYLGLIHKYIYELKNILSKNNSSEARVFVKTPHTIQEIPYNGVYEGINKPKCIVSCSNDGLQFRKDNNYRAGVRHIMLSLRTKTGKLRKWEIVKKLLLHELAHTMCNHITYREEGNHEDDFYNSENLLKSVGSHKLNDIEKEIMKELFFVY